MILSDASDLDHILKASANEDQAALTGRSYEELYDDPEKLHKITARTRDVFKMIAMAMYRLHIYLKVNAPSTLIAAGTRNYGVISILGVGITSLGRTPGNRHGPRRPRKGKSWL